MTDRAAIDARARGHLLALVLDGIASGRIALESDADLAGLHAWLTAVLASLARSSHTTDTASGLRLVDIPDTADGSQASTPDDATHGQDRS